MTDYVMVEREWLRKAANRIDTICTADMCSECEDKYGPCLSYELDGLYLDAKPLPPSAQFAEEMEALIIKIREYGLREKNLSEIFEKAEKIGYKIYCTREEIAAAKESAPAADGWISVEDRLPEDEQSVLVYPIKMHLEEEPVFTAFRRRNLWSYQWAGTVYGLSHKNQPTHWMSLPAPPAQIAAERGE